MHRFLIKMNNEQSNAGLFDLSQTACPALNISECAVSENAEQFVVLAYNGEPWLHSASSYCLHGVNSKH